MGATRRPPARHWNSPSQDVMSRKRWQGTTKKSYVLTNYVHCSRANDRGLQTPSGPRSSFRVITSCLGEFQWPAGSLASARARRPHRYNSLDNSTGRRRHAPPNRQAQWPCSCPGNRGTEPPILRNHRRHFDALRQLRRQRKVEYAHDIIAESTLDPIARRLGL